MSLDELLAIARTVPFHPGAAELIGYLKAKGLKLALVSAGLTVLSDWVHERFGFDFSVSNHLCHEKGVMTGQVTIDVYNDRKEVWVRRIMDRFGAAAEETLAVGDSRGDLEMFRTVGFPVAFNPSCSELDQWARVCVDSGDLADLIPHLPL
jgi:phosphoserine phosphatase